MAVGRGPNAGPCYAALTALGRRAALRRAALRPLGDLCRWMPRVAGRVLLRDGLWGRGGGEPEEEPEVLEFQTTITIDLVPPSALPCPSCLPAASCLNVKTLAALLLLLFDLHVEAVLYHRPPGRSLLVAPCGFFRDSRDALEQLWATAKAAHVLRGWLHAGSGCAGGARPTAAMDAELSDKGSDGHFYTRIYDQVLWPRRCDINDVLEVGIGSMDEYTTSTMALDDAAARNYRPGASLRGWLDVFPRANVTGLDIDRRVRRLPHRPRRRPVPGRRLWTHTVNTMNRTGVVEALGGKSFDLIIDDGYHRPHGQRATLRNLWPHLRQDGQYFIEDALPVVALALAAELHGVAVAGSSWAWLVAARRPPGLPGGRPPLQRVQLARTSWHYNMCWHKDSRGLQDAGQVRAVAWMCCGGNGVFPSWEECGLLNADCRDDCCLAYLLHEHLIA